MTAVPADDFEDTIRDALRIVIDPEIGRSVVDIGLIYKIERQDGGAILIDMTTTTRGCPAAGYLVDAVRECALDTGVSQIVEVRLVYEPAWSPDLMVE
jgi:metal-sulfur cluster biosynthetic enzyme